MPTGSKKKPMEVKPCYVSLQFQRESGNLALEQPVGNLWKSEEAGSQTVQKQGTKVFNIFWNLHLCWHISTGCFTFGVSSLSGQNGPVWKISTDPKAGGCDCTQVCSFSLMLSLILLKGFRTDPEQFSRRPPAKLWNFLKLNQNLLKRDHLPLSSINSLCITIIVLEFEREI